MMSQAIARAGMAVGAAGRGGAIWLLASAVLCFGVERTRAVEQAWETIVTPGGALRSEELRQAQNIVAPLPAPTETRSRRVEPSPAPANPAPATRSRAPADQQPLAEQYCANIGDAAAEARFAWQKKTLGDMERELEKRIAKLEELTSEYQKWLARREEFSRKAQDGLVRIYSRMRPDAAASQLTAMDEETAAAVITKLDPRNASAILNEMEPGHAARLSGTISGAAKITRDERKS